MTGRGSEHSWIGLPQPAQLTLARYGSTLFPFRRPDDPPAEHERLDRMHKRDEAERGSRPNPTRSRFRSPGGTGWCQARDQRPPLRAQRAAPSCARQDARSDPSLLASVKGSRTLIGWLPQQSAGRLGRSRSNRTGQGVAGFGCLPHCAELLSPLTKDRHQ